MNVNGTLYAPYNCYLSTTFILQNKHMCGRIKYSFIDFASWSLFRQCLTYAANAHHYTCLASYELYSSWKLTVHFCLGINGTHSIVPIVAQ